MDPGHYLEDVLRGLEKYKMLAEKALVQVSDEQLFQSLDDESNNLAIIIKHMAGNMRSRWTEFLTSDGEKPDRNRDTEFELQEPETRATLLERWEAGWNCLFTALSNLKPEDLQKTIGGFSVPVFAPAQLCRRQIDQRIVGSSLQPLLNGRLGFVQLVGGFEKDRQVSYCLNIAGLDVQDPAVGGDGAVESAHFLQKAAQVELGLGEVRIRFDGPPVSGCGFF